MVPSLTNYFEKHFSVSIRETSRHFPLEYWSLNCQRFHSRYAIRTGRTKLTCLISVISALISLKLFSSLCLILLLSLFDSILLCKFKVKFISTFSFSLFSNLLARAVLIITKVPRTSNVCFL